MPPAIEIRHVSKHIRHYHEHYASLKERMIHFGRIPYEDFVALDDITVDIDETASELVDTILRGSAA